jgi:hypothetical protein
MELQEGRMIHDTFSALFATRVESCPLGVKLKVHPKGQNFGFELLVYESK